MMVRAIFVGFVAVLVLTMALGIAVLFKPSEQTNLGAELKRLEPLTDSAGIAELVENLPQEVGGLPLVDSNAQPFPVEGRDDALVGQVSYGNQAVGITMGVIGTIDSELAQGRHIKSLLLVTGGPQAECVPGTVRGTGLTPRSSLDDFYDDAEAEAESDVPVWLSCDLDPDPRNNEVRPAVVWSDGSALWLVQASNDALRRSMIDALVEAQS